MSSAAVRRRAFTMVEVAVTLVVLGVLAAALAYGLGAFAGRADRITEGSAADRVMLAEQGLARDYSTYSAWPADLAQVGADVTVTDGVSTGPGVVGVAVGDGGSVGAAVRTSAGECLLRLLGPAGTGAVPATRTLPADRPCTGGEALALANPPESAVTPASVKTP